MPYAFERVEELAPAIAAQAVLSAAKALGELSRKLVVIVAVMLRRFILV
jgi:hypothetical protein